MVANSSCGQLNGESDSTSLPLRLKRWSRETGFTVPSRASPLIRHTQAESSAYSRTLLLPSAFRDGVHIVGVFVDTA